jgi:hypothetical protein
MAHTVAASAVRSLWTVLAPVAWADYTRCGRVARVFDWWEWWQALRAAESSQTETRLGSLRVPLAKSPATLVGDGPELQEAIATYDPLRQIVIAFVRPDPGPRRVACLPVVVAPGPGQDPPPTVVPAAAVPALAGDVVTLH